MIQRERPYALSIAGLDPSGGAGLLADIKTFEASRVYGLGVCTALTAQHDSRFDSVSWISFEQIRAQCLPLLERYPIPVVKIGLIESFEVLDRLVFWLHMEFPAIRLVWDPILKASAGFGFHTGHADAVGCLSSLHLVTPNLPEARQLAGLPEGPEAAVRLSAHCPVYLKGGHGNDPQTVTDYLFRNGMEAARYDSPLIAGGEKHGSGCVISSAIAAQLALGLSLPDACREATSYTRRFLGSSPTLLGFHV